MGLIRRCRSWLARSAWAALFVLSGTLLTRVATAAEAPSTPACPPVAVIPGAEAVQHGMRHAQDHGLLWRVTRQGRSSYLYGTIHAAKLPWVFPGPALMQALQSTDTVALELDVLDADIMQRLLAGMRESPAPSVSASAPAAAQARRQRLRQQVKAQCLPEETLSYFPEMQVTTLLIMAGRLDGVDPSYGIDIFLSGLARGTGKRVVSLETPEAQLRLLRQDTPEDTARFVDESLDALDAGQARSSLLRLAQAWADSDVPTIEGYESWCDCLKSEADKAQMKRLIDDRNPAMADGIEAMHAAGRQVLAAVGSLHMTGPKGLPILLAQRGFKVEPLLPRQARP